MLGFVGSCVQRVRSGLLNSQFLLLDLLNVVFVLMVDEVLCQGFTAHLSLQLLQHKDEHTISKGECLVCFPLGVFRFKVLNWFTFCNTTQKLEEWGFKK